MLALPIVVIGKLSQPAPQIMSTPFWSRPLIAGDALAFYLWKLLLPWRLALDYERTPRYLLHQWWFYVTWMVPVLAAAGIWLWKPGRHWLGAGALLMVAGLSPVLGFVNFDYESYSTVADHYFYLPMLGVALAAAWALARFASRGIVIVVGAFLLAFAA